MYQEREFMRIIGTKVRSLLARKRLIPSNLRMIVVFCARVLKSESGVDDEERA